VLTRTGFHWRGDNEADICIGTVESYSVGAKGKTYDIDVNGVVELGVKPEDIICRYVEFKPKKKKGE